MLPNRTPDLGHPLELAKMFLSPHGLVNRRANNQVTAGCLVASYSRWCLRAAGGMRSCRCCDESEVGGSVLNCIILKPCVFYV